MDHSGCPRLFLVSSLESLYHCVPGGIFNVVRDSDDRVTFVKEHMTAANPGVHRLSIQKRKCILLTIGMKEKQT
jgi:hypothetical protein